MTFWVAGAVVVGSAISAYSADKAADKQVEAGNRSIDAQRSMFDLTQQNIQPYLRLGEQYAGTLASLGAPANSDIGPQLPSSGSSYATRQFGPAELAAGLAPNYEFVRQQGLMAANNQASALGGVAGTGGQRGAIDYATNLAGNAYQQAFNNYQNQRNAIFGNLRDIASLGSNAAVGQGTISSNVGANIGNTLTGIGNAQAGGIVGGANAITGGVNNYLGYNYLSNMGNNAAIPGYGAGSMQNAWRPSPVGSPDFIGPPGP